MLFRSARVEVGRDRFEKKNLGKMPTQEMFHLSATSRPRDAKFETDLFEGVVDE